MEINKINAPSKLFITDLKILNERSRKTLDFKTPKEKFRQLLSH
jgi:IS30 family transposase